MPERGDKRTQRAVLTFLLDEFPARHTMTTLWWMGLGDLDALEEAIQKLDAGGFCGGMGALWPPPPPPVTSTGWNSRDGSSRR
ncbi:MAG: hypothetical protein ACTHK6_08930 [Solirubrobacterales bacterium]